MSPASSTTGIGHTFPGLARPGPSGLQSRASKNIEEHRKLFARYPQTRYGAKVDRSKRGKGPRRVPTCTLKFVCHQVQVDIKSVLAFITGTAQMPTSEITIQFLSESEHNTLPNPDTCTNSLKLPTCYSTYEEFQSAFDSTVTIQGKGYGRP